MSNQLTAAVTKPSALAVMATRFNVDPAKLHSTLKSTIFKGATDDELMALVIVANTYGLNPILKELFAFPAKGGGIVPVVSVDGWNRMANDHSQMDGIEFEFEHDKDGKLVSCTCSIWRKDRTRPVKVTEYLSECRRPTDPWKMEHRMLRHKALIQCSRIAFGFSGIVDEDDAAVIARDVTPPAPASESKLFKKLKDSKGTQEKEAPPSPIAAQVEKLMDEEAAEQQAGFDLDTPSVPLIDQVKAALKGSGATWKDINQQAMDGGIFVEDSRATIDECSETELRDLLSVMPQVLAALKGGNK